MNIKMLRTVSLVAQRGSFAAAARSLNVDPSSVSRTVAQVEAELGLRLFQRSTRVLRTTEEGAVYIAEIEPLLVEFERAEDVARNVAMGPTGNLKMTTSVSFAQVCVVPHIAEFLDRYPNVSLELIPTDSNVDMIADNIDLAVRLAPAPTGDVISTRLRTTKYIVCATSDYLDRNPPISKPKDLADHDCLRFALPDYRRAWLFRDNDGTITEVPISGRVVISNALALKSAALEGMGPVLMPDWLIQDELAEGALIDLFPAYECAATEFDAGAWAIYPSRSYLPQKVRVMIDFMREKLSR